ncbi:hypothetical protein GIB67_001537 [Kingdonia uniflora]|uniref:Uncharacterized protein n=1 Tax=Kingdonia uniflora TaxID=39325 RepID=A0A7J7LZE7_9MAGN|nr:hypothetical protein GIB67_001537 [Kingdonia uniflora]
MKEDRILNDVVHEQFIKSFKELLEKLKEKTKECEALNEQNTKLVKDLRIQAAVDDCNASLSWELAKKTKECQVLNEKKTKLVEDLRIKIGVDAFNASLALELAKQRRECKLLQDINAKLADQSERQHPTHVPRSQLIIVEEMKKALEIDHYEWAWRQAMKKEFHNRELADKDDPTFIEQFDQYDRFYTIAHQGPKGDYQDDFTVTGRNQNKLMEVRRANVVLKKKINETLFQLYVKFPLNVHSVQGEYGNSAFRVPTTIKHQSQSQFKKVMNSLESLMTKDPVFRCPFQFSRKNNHISNEKRFENLVGDTTKFWWVGLGSDNQYAILFTRCEAPMPPVSTLWLAHIDLGLRGDFQRDMVQKWFGVTNKLFKALLKENNVKGYKMNDLI